MCGLDTGPTHEEDLWLLTSFVLASIIYKLLDRNQDMHIALDIVDMVA